MSVEIVRSEITRQAHEAVEEMLNAATLNVDDICVVGCSTSEITGNMIGSCSNIETAHAVFSAVYECLKPHGLFLAAQCCEHLNRALVVERECAKKYGFTIVHAVPKPHAGGAFATFAAEAFSDFVLVEDIKASAVCGMDIGGTFIGMHLRPVAVPVRTNKRNVGLARLSMAFTRPKYIGGERAEYR